MSTTDIREQAAHWVERITDPVDELTDAERATFNEWIADPLNAQEFQAMNNIVTVAGDLPVAVRARWSEWAANFRESDHHESSHHDSTHHAEDRTHSRRQVLRYVAMAASLIVVLVAGGYFAMTHHLFGGETFVTGTGQTRTVTFQEGSVAYLNTRTELRWIGTDEDRLVELEQGEALFDIVHDATRPFRVKLDDSEIRVLGTRFNVYRKANGDTAVTVVEGTVEVRGFGDGSAGTEWVRTLHANDQIEYSALGLVRDPHKVQAQKATRWRDGLYRFEDERIEDVLKELARYTDKRIVVRDPRIADHHIGGTLSTRDIRDSLRRMKGLAPIEVNENNNTFTLDYRAEADAQRKD